MELPSGLLWARGNLAKKINTTEYYIGEETNKDTFFSWANANGYTVGETYSFDEANYSSTPGYSLGAFNGNYSEYDTRYDAGCAHFGSPVRVPTRDDYNELINNTDKEEATINGIAGYKFMKKTNHEVYIFFPKCGSWQGTSVVYTDNGFYWTRNNTTSYNAIRFESNGPSVGGSRRERGMCLRIVK